MEKKPLILAVDDEPSNLVLISAALEENYTLALAKSAELAKRFLQRKKPALILLDILMPDEDGLSFAEQLMEGEETFSIPFAFVTGSSDPDFRRKARALGALGFIEKPIAAEQLKSFVNSVFMERG